jgi:predicted Zn-ribbon and HTH transcriptional regulator
MQKAKKAIKRKVEASGCTIPGRVSDSVLNRFAFKRPEREAQAIREYVEWQSQKEKVSYLEKVASEHLFDRKHDTWDVHTDGERYWVITNPTNLYSQELFPSSDYTLSFHIGLMARMMARRDGAEDGEQQDRLATAWRRWTQAAEALDRADEAEEFQAVGMRCRECLLAFVRAVAQDSMVPNGIERPKNADFIKWSELIANAVAKGSSSDEIRGYLKTLAKGTWQLVSWLTHASNAVRFDGHMALEATQATLAAFGRALLRFERATPDRCPHCHSYRIGTENASTPDIDPPYIIFCESCGWNTVPNLSVTKQPRKASTPST